MSAHEDFPIREIQNERRRLEEEKERLVPKRDRLFMTVESGDDSGFALTKVLKDLKKIEQRIGQLDDLLRRKGLHT